MLLIDTIALDMLCSPSGLAFRFSDLRSLFYLAHQEDHKGITRPPSEIYKLVNNYRTHSGVLNLANSAVTLIEHFFPQVGCYGRHIAPGNSGVVITR